VKSNRTATMRWIIIIGLLTSSLLFQQSAHAASDLACNHLGELIRFHFDCCGSNSSSPACEGLLNAAEHANCVDFCNPCTQIGALPAKVGCGCTIGPTDPGLPQFGSAPQFACTDPFGAGPECCVSDPNIGSLCETTFHPNTTFTAACF